MKSHYGLEKRHRKNLELAIIGAGAAGLSAAIYASLLDINYVLLDAEAGGGLMNLAKTVENFPGVTGMRGVEITEGLIRQLEMAGGRLNSLEPAEEFHFSSDGNFRIITSADKYLPKTVIIATGLELLGLKEEFGINDERKYLGKGVSYCAECDGPLYKGKKVLVMGNPFDAFLLKRLCGAVYYLGPVPDEFSSKVPAEIIEANDIKYIEGRIDELVGDNFLSAVIINGKRLEIDGLFLTKRKAGSEIFEKAGLKLDDKGFIVVNKRMETNINGIYAAGDITGEPWQISKSIGEGAVACLSAFKFLTGQEMRNLGWSLQDEWIS